MERRTFIRVLGVLAAVLMLGSLAGCSGSIHPNVRYPFTGSIWHVVDESGIEMMDEMSDQQLLTVSFCFNTDRTAYIRVGEKIDGFDWYEKDGAIAMFVPGMGYHVMSYSVEGNTLTLREGSRYIKLSR